MLYAAAQTMARGRWSGLIACAGHPSRRLCPCRGRCRRAVGALHAVPMLYMAVKSAGAAYLIWLGISMLRAKPREDVALQASNRDPAAAPSSKASRSRFSIRKRRSSSWRSCRNSLTHRQRCRLVNVAERAQSTPSIAMTESAGHRPGSRSCLRPPRVLGRHRDVEDHGSRSRARSCDLSASNRVAGSTASASAGWLQRAAISR